MSRGIYMESLGALRRLLGEARGLRPIYRRMPSGKRCKQCLIPFHGLFSLKFRAIGIGPSRKNPSLCTL